MKRENLFRLALVTHSQAPETLNKYINLLSKIVIMESNEVTFSTASISKLIHQKFELEFLEEEIMNAISTDEDFELDKIEKLCSIKAEGIQRLKDIDGNTKTIEIFIDEFVQLFHKEIKKEEKIKITELIMQYIYYCFNSGKNSLISLLTKCNDEAISEDFSATNEYKIIINSFLEWDNPSKNECIYSIVSYCLDYGMLTAKKDVDDCKKVFEGVQFYLDSNIIIRLMGMNNVERQEVTRHFVDKCAEVGIDICYTNFTYQELLHTISNVVKYVRYFNNGDKPISPTELDKLGEYDNKDFYENYYNWCKHGQNRYDDYQAYLDFLKQSVNTYISGFSKVDLNNAEHTDLKKEFLSLSSGLMDYKNDRNPQRRCTMESAKIDVNNFLFIKYDNAEMHEVSNSRKSFFISTDRRFYDWANKVIPCLPTVFLPSEWLSIILKYTSRTDSDYNTFCKFMNLRLVQDEKRKQRTIQIIKSINELTSDVEVKTKIISQITDNIVFLSEGFDDGNDEIVTKAFDKVIQEQKDESEKEINNKLEDKEKEYEKKLEELKGKSLEEIENAKQATKEEVTRNIAKGIVDKKMEKWNWLNEHIISANILGGIITFFILIAITNISVIENFIYDFCNSSKLLKDGKFAFTLALAGAASLIVLFIITTIVKYMSSENRKQKRIIKEEVKLKEMKVE